MLPKSKTTLLARIASSQLYYLALAASPLVFIALFIAPTFIATGARASSIKMTLHEMTDKADLIFVGTVVSVIETGRGPGGVILSSMSLSAELRARYPGQVPVSSLSLSSVNLNTVELLKHRTGIPLSSTSTITFMISRQAQHRLVLEPGERIVVFCAHDSHVGGFRMIAGAQSMFRMRPHDGLTEYSAYTYWYPSAKTPKHYGKSKYDKPIPVSKVESGDAISGPEGGSPMLEKDFLNAIRNRINKK